MKSRLKKSGKVCPFCNGTGLDPEDVIHNCLENESGICSVCDVDSIIYAHDNFGKAFCFNCWYRRMDD
jgi:hypothetical protein